MHPLSDVSGAVLFGSNASIYEAFVPNTCACVAAGSLKEAVDGALVDAVRVQAGNGFPGVLLGVADGETHQRSVFSALQVRCDDRARAVLHEFLEPRHQVI